VNYIVVVEGKEVSKEVFKKILRATAMRSHFSQCVRFCPKMSSKSKVITNRRSKTKVCNISFSNIMSTSPHSYFLLPPFSWLCLPVAACYLEHLFVPCTCATLWNVLQSTGDDEEREDIGEMFAVYGSGSKGGSLKTNSRGNLNRLSPFSVSHTYLLTFVIIICFFSHSM